jgi:membrane protease YdiL (CAAX protease family)
MALTVTKLVKSFDNVAFYGFSLVVLVLILLQPNDPEATLNTVNVYLVVVAIAIVLPLVARSSIVELAGLRPSKLTSRMVVIILLLMLFSNCFAFWLKSMPPESPFVLRPFSILFLVNKVFFVGTRTFAEELIFRGFLLLPYFSANNKAFWRANLAQAVLFTSIHALIPMPLLPRLLFVVFVLFWSILSAWLNRKAGSLLPSWILHWTNGILSAWIFMQVT